MKKIFTSILVSLLFLNGISQTILLQENWTTYAGTAGTAPIGYYISNHGNYTTVASSGTSGPNSFRFGVTNATIITPQFAAGADSLKFWLKHNPSGTPANDTLSTFYVYESLDSSLFTPVDSIRPLPTNSSGKTYSYKLLASTQWLKFVYKKIGGNAAFDDLRVLKNPPVVANFNFSNVCQGICTPFTDASTATNGITLYAWDFNNDLIPDANTANPCYTFPSAGTYTVNLAVYDAMLNGDTITKIVTVHAKPLPVIYSFQSPAVCVGDTLCYSNNSTGGLAPYTAQWTFLNNVQYSGDTICHVVDSTFLQVVKMKVTDANGCIDSTMLALQVSNPPNANFSVNNICLGASVCVSASNDPNNCGSNWDFGDGNTGNGTPICHLYNSPGNYIIQHTVTSCGTCPASVITKTVTVYALPQAGFTYMNTGGNSFSFSDLSTPAGSIAVWSWNFGDPSSGGNNTSGLQNPGHTFTSAGAYTVSLFVVDTNGCQNIDTVVVSTTGIQHQEFGQNIYWQEHATQYELKSTQAFEEWQLSDLQGRVVMQNKEISNVLIIKKNAFEKGIYFIRLRKGNAYFVRKVYLE
jgi:PKD repeat protein